MKNSMCQLLFCWLLLVLVWHSGVSMARGVWGMRHVTTLRACFFPFLFFCVSEDI
jgi:hypothetical protein